IGILAQHQNPARRRAFGQTMGCREPAYPGHLDVEHHHLRTGPGGHRQSLFAARRLADDLAIAFEERAQPFTYEAMIVSKENLDSRPGLHRTGLLRRLSAERAADSNRARVLPSRRRTRSSCHPEGPQARDCSGPRRHADYRVRLYHSRLAKEPRMV